MMEQNQRPLMRVSTFGDFALKRLAGAEYHLVLQGEWGNRVTAMTLLKVLLCSADRRATRSALIEAIWPSDKRSKGGKPIDTEHALHGAASTLRRILRTTNRESLLLTTSGSDGVGYRLEGQPLLWCDLDAFEAYLKRAMGTKDTEKALALWESALRLSQGVFLPDDRYSEWSQVRRRTLEGDRRLCVHQLATLYTGSQRFEEAEVVLRAFWAENLTDEDVLCRLLLLLERQQRYQEALLLYGQTQQALKNDGLRPAARTKELVERIRNQPIEKDHQSASSSIRVYRPPQMVEVPNQALLSVSHGLTIQELETQDMNPSRRELLQHTPHLVSAAFFVPDVLDQVLVERFTRALARPSTIDEATLRYLEYRTDSYWRDWHSAALASCDLLSYVIEHLQKVIVLLEGPLLPMIRIRLCSTASWTALLVGELFFNLCYYARARKFLQAAIIAAQEANHPGLEAIAWGWMSFTWTYDNHPQAALTSIQKARSLAIGNVSTTVRAWLAAIEAEVQVNLSNRDACLKALDEAERIEEHSLEERYLIHFDHSLLGGYQGVCFRKLYRPEDAQSIVFLGKAQHILKGALASLDPALIQRQSTFLTDLASTYAQQGEVEEACKYAVHATTIAIQLKQQKVVQLLFILRQELEPWKDTQYVQNLDEQMLQLTPGNV